MTTGNDLRQARLERGWKLIDVARALGVTTATISRVERGLQEPAPSLLEAWRRILEGKLLPSLPKAARRCPRGALNLLGEVLLIDVKAGLDRTSAGWREPAEVGLSDADISYLGREIEYDSLGRIRISLSSSLSPVKEVLRILDYRETMEIEKLKLREAFQYHISSLWSALRSEETRGAPLLFGLGKMVLSTAPFVQDATRSLGEANTDSLLRAPTEVSALILEAVNVRIPEQPDKVLKDTGLQALTIPIAPSREIALQARQVAKALLIPDFARKFGRRCVTVLGAAWAYSALLDASGVVIMTEWGQQQVAEEFWYEMNFPRTAISSTWRKVMESITNDERERIGSLLWAWPEVL